MGQADTGMTWSRVGTSYSANFEARSDLGWQPPLGSAEDNIQKLLVRGYRRNILPCGLHVFGVRCGMMVKVKDEEVDMYLERRDFPLPSNKKKKKNFGG